MTDKEIEYSIGLLKKTIELTNKRIDLLNKSFIAVLDELLEIAKTIENKE